MERVIYLAKDRSYVMGGDDKPEGANADHLALPALLRAGWKVKLMSVAAAGHDAVGYAVLEKPDE